MPFVIGMIVAAAAFLVLAVLLKYVRIVNQYSKGVVFRLGKFTGIREPGLTVLVPVLDSMRIVDMRVQNDLLEDMEVITADNVPLKITAAVWYAVVNAEKSVVAIQDPEDSINDVALTAMMQVVGQKTIDEVLRSQATINEEIAQAVDSVTESWGIQLQRAQISNIVIPDNIQRAMSQEAEATREKNARIIKAEGEKSAAAVLVEAANEIAKNPMALELRRMQMVTEVGAEQNTTTIVMMPYQLVDAAKGIGQLGDAAAKFLGFSASGADQQ